MWLVFSHVRRWVSAVSAPSAVSALSELAFEHRLQPALQNVKVALRDEDAGKRKELRMDKILTLSGAGRVLGVTHAAIHSRCKTGSLPAVKGGDGKGGERIIGVLADAVYADARRKRLC